MKMEMKYVAPEVEILEIEVEKGFAATGGSGGGYELGEGEEL